MHVQVVGARLQRVLATPVAVRLGWYGQLQPRCQTGRALDRTGTGQDWRQALVDADNRRHLMMTGHTINIESVTTPPLQYAVTAVA